MRGYRIIERRRAAKLGYWRGPVKGIMCGLAGLYRIGLAGWYASYRLHIAKVRKLPVPVISVGNITVGGSGKTPFVIMLYNMLTQRGIEVAVLTRGYGRRGRELVYLDEEGSWQDVGDEPVMMREYVKHIVVCRDRFKAGEFAVRVLGVDALLLDDGFQHRRLGRDLDILLFDASQEGTLALIPAGRLREGLSAMRRADMVVLTHADKAWDLEQARRTVARFAPGKPLLLARHKPKGVRRGREEYPLEVLENAKVLAFSGIGKPEGFEKSLISLGAELVGAVRFSDHHPYSPEDYQYLEELKERWGAEMLVTTSKDAVRLAGQFLEEVFVLEVEMEIMEGAEHLEHALGRVLRRVRG